MDANGFKLKLVEEISNCDEILEGKHLENLQSYIEMLNIDRRH